MGGLLDIGPERVWVEDSAGTGLPLVLLHPGLADSRVWDRLLPELGDRRVVRYDQPGYGRSPRATRAAPPVEHLAGVLDALSIDRAHLVGNSMGGGSALALAVASPERVASLTLLCTAVPGYPWPEEVGNPDDEAELERVTAAGDVDGLTELCVRVYLAQGVDDTLREQVRASSALELSGEDLAEPDPAVWDDVGSIVAPTTIVVGDRDDPDTVHANLALAGRMPGGDLVRLDTDHVPQYRDPNGVADLVRRTTARAGD